MSGDENSVHGVSEQGEQPQPTAAEIAVPNLKNTKRVDCGQGRIALVRCASEVTKADLIVQAGGASGPHEPRYYIECARWGITSLQGDWGKAPDGKPWSKVQSPLGPVQSRDLVATLSASVIGEIAAYVNFGAYLSEVQGKD